MLFQLLPSCRKAHSLTRILTCEILLPHIRTTCSRKGSISRRRNRRRIMCAAMSHWDDERFARILGLRMKTFYNADYFDRIVLPLLDIPNAGRVLDVGCGYGGL